MYVCIYEDRRGMRVTMRVVILCLSLQADKAATFKEEEGAAASDAKPESKEPGKLVEKACVYKNVFIHMYIYVYI